MLVPKGTIVAVADGEKLNLFSNTGDEASPALTAMPEVDVENVNKGSGASHQSSSANPNEKQAAEDGFAGGIAGLLNKRVLDGGIPISSSSPLRAPSASFAKATTKSCPKFFAARFRKTLRVMRCTISRKQSLRLNALSASE